MTQQDKELLIKDLCARLPYGVKGIYDFCNENESPDIITGISDCDSDVNLIYSNKGYVGAISDIIQFKPILFPLSAMNQEIEVNGEKVCVRRNIEDIQLAIDETGDLDTDDIWSINPYEYIKVPDTFNRYHIDYRGLIDKGIAISVFDLPENPYK